MLGLRDAERGGGTALSRHADGGGCRGGRYVGRVIRNLGVGEEGEGGCV
jgi:hypothetical protein